MVYKKGKRTFKKRNYKGYKKRMFKNKRFKKPYGKNIGSQ